MKKWILKNKLSLIGVLFGALAGYVYWKYVGCLTGTCAITSNPIRSTIYFAVMGGLIFSFLKKQPKMQPPTTNYNESI
jgi:hypothetical protein